MKAPEQARFENVGTSLACKLGSGKYQFVFHWGNDNIKKNKGENKK